MAKFLKTTLFLTILLGIFSLGAVVSAGFAFPKTPKDPPTETRNQETTEHEKAEDISLALPKDQEKNEIVYNNVDNFLSQNKKTPESIEKNKPAQAQNDQSIEYSKQNKSKDENPEHISFTLQTPSKHYLASAPGGSTLEEAMRLAADQTDFTYETKNFGPGMGAFVVSIEGLENDIEQGKYWIYSINGQKGTRGISQAIIQPNDIISWQYEDEE